MRSSKHRRGLMLLVQIIGLSATGCLIWFRSVAPRLHRESLDSVAIEALSNALLACVWSTAIMLGLQLLVLRSTRPDKALAITLRTARTAIWFAPATLLLSRLSPAALAASLVLIVSTTRLLYFEWLETGGSPEVSRVETRAPTFTGVLPHTFRMTELVPCVAAAFVLQAAIASTLWGAFVRGAALLCLSAAILTLLVLTAGIYPAAKPQALPRSILGLLLTVILAAGLTTGGLAGNLGGNSGSGGNPSSQTSPGLLQSLRALLRGLVNPDGGGSKKASKTNPSRHVTEIADGSFPGIILLTEAKPYTILVSPPPSWTHGTLAGTPPLPYTIPFSGEYWMFRQPDRIPPPGSFFRKMNPQALSFFTTDHRPLTMEAHQKLDHSIDLTCCREIKIAISNADRYPGTVTLELILIDARAKGRQSLGKAEVRSRPQLSWKDASPAPEILEFSIPSASAIHEFNELEIIFHRDRLRIDMSARMSIERFILVPRS